VVFFVNKLTLNGPAEELERIYGAVADFMSGQPGLVGYTLLRSTTRPEVYLNVAEWTDLASFDRARTQERFAGGERVTAVSSGERHLCEVVFRGGPSAGTLTPGTGAPGVAG